MCKCGYINTRGEREDGLIANNTETVVAFLLLSQMQIMSGPESDHTL